MIKVIKKSPLQANTDNGEHKGNKLMIISEMTKTIYTVNSHVLCQYGYDNFFTFLSISRCTRWFKYDRD